MMNKTMDYNSFHIHIVLFIICSILFQMFARREFTTRSSNNDKADNGRIFIIVGILCISSPAIYGDTSTYFYLCYTTINVGMCKAMCITTQHQLQPKKSLMTACPMSMLCQLFSLTRTVHLHKINFVLPKV